MLCVTLTAYTRPCGGVSGGVSNIWIFDPSDFNFTQTAAGDAYTVAARRTGATAVGGALMFPVKFQSKESEFKFKHTVNGCSVKYEFEMSAQLPDLSNDLTNFLSALDSAGCCCGLGIAVLFNTGKLFIIGEKYVNDSLIPYFEVMMNGTEGGSGKKFEDFNGANVMFKGEYNRMAREFTGGVSVITGFETA